MEFKIMKTAEDIIRDIQIEFGDEYEVDICENFSTTNILKISNNAIWIKVFIDTHYDYSTNAISSDLADKKYVTITVIDYYGNKKSDISSYYINEIKKVIDEMKYKINQYACFCKALESFIETDFDACVVKTYFNDKNHLFLRNRDNILCIKPRININNDKVIAEVIPLSSGYNEPVIEFNVYNGDMKEVYDDLSFFL